LTPPHLASVLTAAGSRRAARGCDYNWGKSGPAPISRLDTVSRVVEQPSDRQTSIRQTNLMQFWDAPSGPSDVEELMASWRTDPHFVYHRYCWESAHAFIRNRFDHRMLAVFESCAVPAMQSDVFRLCWLFEEGGIYVDADQGNRRRNESFTDRTSRGHLFFRNPHTGIITNNLMSFFDRHDPLVGALLERVSGNVERQIDGAVWGVTGPGAISKLFAEVGPEHVLFENVRIHGVMELSHAMNFVRCDYKSSTTHWPNITGSIYRSLR
jgi:mannosyltransferase OCH1-like enzyme